MNRKSQLESFWKEDPTDPFIPYALALEFIREQNVPEARIWLERTLHTDANYIPALYQLSQLLLQNGSPEIAKPYLERGMTLCQQNGDMKTWAEFRTLAPEAED